jgi:hypothetical protein
LDQVLTQIDHPSAWNAADMARPEDWQATLPAPVLAELLDEAAGIDTTDNASITRHAVDPARLPKAAAFMAGIEHEVMAGRGFVLLRGLDPALPDATMKAAYWVMGKLMGDPASQNVHGETLTDVRDYGKQMHAKQVRSYETNANLKLHTDRAELVGLLCLQRARTGGLSSIASSIAVYNAMLAEHPDLLEPLFTGPHCVRNEAMARTSSTACRCCRSRTAHCLAVTRATTWIPRCATARRTPSRKRTPSTGSTPMPPIPGSGST